MFNTISMKDLEHRYQLENKLMGAVSLGEETNALKFHSELLLTVSKIDRLKNSIVNKKNLLTILNVILRKATELGCVHPYYLDKLSSQFTLEINSITHINQCDKLSNKMIIDYCTLVKNHSLRDYSPLMRHAINFINLNIYSPLTVVQVAEELSITPDYLARLFRKENNTTVIEYINKQKINLAKMFLDKTDLQIQAVSLKLGIEDISYFSRIFKKYTGITPTQYRMKP